MIDVRVHYRSSGSKRLPIGYKILGHSEDPRICAGISALSQHTILCLREIATASPFVIVESKAGYVNMYYKKQPAPAWRLEQCDFILKCLILSIRKMVEENPGHINLYEYEHAGDTC